MLNNIDNISLFFLKKWLCFHLISYFHLKILGLKNAQYERYYVSRQLLWNYMYLTWVIFTHFVGKGDEFGHSIANFIGNITALILDFSPSEESVAFNKNKKRPQCVLPIDQSELICPAPFWTSSLFPVEVVEPLSPALLLCSRSDLIRYLRPWDTCGHTLTGLGSGQGEDCIGQESLFIRCPLT